MERIYSKSNTALVIILSLAMSGCESLLFHPSRSISVTPSFINIDYRDVYIDGETQNATIHAWFMQPVNPSHTANSTTRGHSLRLNSKTNGCVLVVHGNGGNITSTLPVASWWTRQGYNVLAFDYQGYGLSSGVPSINAALSDVDRAWRWLQEEPSCLDGQRVVLGQSLGAVIAAAQFHRYIDTQTSQYLSADFIILDSGFASFNKIAREVAAKNIFTWGLQWLAPLLIPKTSNLQDNLTELSTASKILVTHGKRDAIVSYRHFEQLKTHTKSSAAFYAYDGSHIELFSQKSGQDRVLQFMRHSSSLSD